jgi:signal peptidase II
MTEPRLFRHGLIVAVLILVADQVSKWWVLKVLFGLAEPITTASWAPPIRITGFLDFAMVWNYGISFGLLAGDAPLVRWGLSAVAVAVVAGLLVWLARNDRGLVALGVGLIIGGAIGNVIDRLRFGAVADFLHFHAGEYSFWVFNLADSAISIGVMLLIADSLFGRRTHPVTAQQRDRS